MRWIKRAPPQPKIGEHRSVSGFLWTPKTIGDETRWLERASWTEQYVTVGSGYAYWREWRASEWNRKP